MGKKKGVNRTLVDLSTFSSKDLSSTVWKAALGLIQRGTVWARPRVEVLHPLLPPKDFRFPILTRTGRVWDLTPNQPEKRAQSKSIDEPEHHVKRRRALSPQRGIPDK